MVTNISWDDLGKIRFEEVIASIYGDLLELDLNDDGGEFTLTYDEESGQFILSNKEVGKNESKI
jgi:fructose-1,6-bisphosphatase